MSKPKSIKVKLNKCNPEPEVIPSGNIVGDIAGYEEINHPKHYNGLPNGIECIDVIEHFKGNIALSIKHLWRAGLKPGQGRAKDLKKALWYIQREINLEEGNVPKITK